MASVERLSLSLSLRLLHSESEKGERNGTEKRRFFVSATSAADSSPSFSLSLENVCVYVLLVAVFAVLLTCYLKVQERGGKSENKRRKRVFSLRRSCKPNPRFVLPRIERVEILNSFSALNKTDPASSLSLPLSLVSRRLCCGTSLFEI